MFAPKIFFSTEFWWQVPLPFLFPASYAYGHRRLEAISFSWSAHHDNVSGRRSFIHSFIHYLFTTNHHHLATNDNATFHWRIRCCHFAPPREGCDVLRWVCLSVCLFARVTRKPHDRTSPHSVLPMALAQFSGDVAIRLCSNMYFRFCGWRYVFISWTNGNSPGGGVTRMSTTVFGGVQHNAAPGEVCSLWLPCLLIDWSVN